jgi:hypothetical protein
MCLRAGGSTRNEGVVTYPEICYPIGRSSRLHGQAGMIVLRLAILWVSIWYKPGASSANVPSTNGMRIK